MIISRIWDVVDFCFYFLDVGFLFDFRGWLGVLEVFGDLGNGKVLLVLG